MVGPVGVKIGSADKLDIPDIFAMPQADVNKLVYHDPSKAPDIGKMPDDELAIMLPQPRDHGAAGLGAVDAQSQAQAPPASREGAGAVCPRRQRRSRVRRLSDELTPAAAERAHVDDPGRPATRRISSSPRRSRRPSSNSSKRDFWRPDMRAWHFSETAYPYLPPADTYPSIRVSAAQPHLRSEEGRRALRPLYRRMADRRGRRRRDHAQRASSDRDLRRSRGAADAGGAGAAEQEGAASDPRQSDRQPPPAGARGRRDGDDRRACRTAGSRPASCAACPTRSCRPTAIRCG